MADTYTLHLPEYAVPGDPDALERAEVVRDGFSWWAFLAPMLWLFWHRHWLLGVAAGLIVGLVAVGLSALGLRFGAVLAIEILIHLLFGLEAASLRRFAYARRGRPVSDIVLATDAADAEAKSFARWLAPGPARPGWASAPAASGHRAGPEAIIGLFPDREGR